MHYSQIPIPDGDKAQLRSDDSTADGACNFLGALYAETAMPIAITNGHKSLETSPLSGTRLLLDGHDLHHFVLQWARGDLRKEEMVDDLISQQKVHVELWKLHTPYFFRT